MSAQHRILIGMLASNQKAKTLRCLDSLAASRPREFDLFFVDNASSERIGEAANAFPFVTVSEQSHNAGCAGGRNIVLDYFHGQGRWDYLLFLDNDAVVPNGAIGRLLAAAEGAEHGMRIGGLGPHVAHVDNPGRLWCAGGALIDWPACWFKDSGQGLPTQGTFAQPRALDTLTGGFMFVTRPAATAAGRFVGDYFIYMEDTDWCWRMKRAGYELRSEPGSLFLHDSSSSLGRCSPRFHFLRTRNRLWFFQAYSRETRTRVRRKIVADVWRNKIYMELASGRPRAAWAAARGLASGWRVPRGILATGKSVFTQGDRS